MWTRREMWEHADAEHGDSQWVRTAGRGPAPQLLPTDDSTMCGFSSVFYCPHLENTKSTLRKHSEHIQKTLRKNSGNTQRTFREHSGNTQSTLRDTPLRYLFLGSTRYFVRYFVHIKSFFKCTKNAKIHLFMLPYVRP